MKAGIIFTGTGPILILTTFQSFDAPKFIQKLKTKGVMKFIAYELNPDLVEKRYGGKYRAIMNDVQQEDDLRVLDYNGHNVFYNFSFLSDVQAPFIFEPETP
jgi:hypothetical protein